MNEPLPAPLPPRRRWLLKLLGGLVVTLAIIIAAAPALVSSIPALRDAVVHAVVGPLNGDVTVERLDAGWFRQLVITNVRVLPKSGEPVLTIDRIESDRALWQMVTSPADLGTLRIERPIAFLEFYEQGTNWTGLFQRKHESTTPKPSKPHTPFDLGVRARIVDGTLRGKAKITGEPWEIGGLNIGVGLRAASRSPSGKQELLVDAGTIIDHRELSTGLCNDVLKYAAPALANAATANGQITIELEDWRLPIGDPASGDLSGRLTMHTVNVGPGPLVRSIVALPILSQLIERWQLPAFVQLARESTVPFKLIQRRIYHEHLRFSLAELIDIETQGYVGFDETLELTAVLGFHPPKPEDRKLAALRVLTTQPWPIKIGGHLGQPVVDASPLKESGLDLVSKALQDMESGHDSIGARTFQALNNAGVPLEPNDVRQLLQLLRTATSQTGTTAATPDAPTPNPPTSGAAAPAPVDGVQIAVDILETLRRRREAARAQPIAPPPPGFSNPPSSEPPPRRPLLRQGLRMLLEPPPPAPTPTPPIPMPPTPNVP